MERYSLSFFALLALLTLPLGAQDSPKADTLSDEERGRLEQVEVYAKVWESIHKLDYFAASAKKESFEEIGKIYEMYGTAFFVLQKYDDAIRTYEKGLKFAPKSRDLRLGLANAASFSNRSLQADSLYEELIGELKNLPKPRLEFGTVLRAYHHHLLRSKNKKKAKAIEKQIRDLDWGP